MNQETPLADQGIARPWAYSGAVTTTPKWRDKTLYPPSRLGKICNRLNLLGTAYSAFSTQRKCPKFRSSTHLGPALFGLRQAALYPHLSDSCSHMGSVSVLGHFPSSLVLPGTFQSTIANRICCSADVLHQCCRSPCHTGLPVLVRASGTGTLYFQLNFRQRPGTRSCWVILVVNKCDDLCDDLRV